MSNSSSTVKSQHTPTAPSQDLDENSAVSEPFTYEIPDFNHTSCLHEDDMPTFEQSSSLNEKIHKQICCLISNNVDISNIRNKSFKTKISEIISKDYIPYIDKIVETRIKQSVDKALKEISTVEYLDKKIKNAQLKIVELQLEALVEEKLKRTRKKNCQCGDCGKQLPTSIYKNNCDECAYYTDSDADSDDYYENPGKCSHHWDFDEIQTWNCCDISWDLLYFGESPNSK